MQEHTPFADALAKLEFARLRSHIAGHCATLFGQERIEKLTPSPMFALVRDELARVDEMHALIDADDAPPLESLDDMRPALHRAAKAGSMIASEDFLEILHLLVTGRKLKAFFAKRSERLALLAQLASELHEDKMLEFHIDRVVDQEGKVKDNASKELRNLRREIIEKSGQLRRRMEAILKRVSEDEIVMEELVTMRDGRMVLPVKTEYKRQIQGFIHSSSASGQTVYIEPTETLDLNNEIRDLQFAEIREVAAILTDLTDRLRAAVQPLLRSVELVGEIDSLYARARYGNAVLGACPHVKLEGSLVLEHARHPLLLLHKKMKDVVPLDITLGEEATTIIITGPNAGGKSVTMKTVGLLVLMVQSGIPVPCDAKSEFPMYTDVHVDIGDEQSLENDLSTFSSHISRLARIVSTARAKSLVLIDEIGTGTDPSEGSALGAAILERLTQARAHVIATTHHGMLKAFAYEQADMQNAAMEFDLQTLEPTYVFRSGLPGSSYAFEITRRHGMDPAIIERAREIGGTQSDALEQLLAEVERQSQELGIRLRRTEQQEDKFNQLSTEYDQKLKAMKQEGKEFKRQSLEQAERILHDANAAVEEAIRGIREEQASKEAIRRAHDRVEKSRSEVREQLSELLPVAHRDESPSAEIHSGDEVAMRDNPQTKGIALADPERGKVEVAFGSLRMSVDLARLQRVVQPAEREHASIQHIEEPLEKNEIDVRGMYGDDAIREIDRFLYQAWSSGLKRVDIIHGKGTGALRQRVQAYLHDIPFVEQYALAEWNEGGSGMTKVFFKND
ncbi:MAG: endonuclease MutS2 [Bacteroidetes bacterium]|nr:endonuclease MutS2 [Bacteroidota bacterium]